MAEKHIKKAGLKVTQPRLRILSCLEKKSSGHYSAEDIYRQLQEKGEVVGIATIYRVLAQFEQAGLVARHHFQDGQAVYELERGGHHDHIICLQCAAVVEFYDENLEQRQHHIAAQHDFSINDHRLILYAHCQRKNCQRGDNTQHFSASQERAR